MLSASRLNHVAEALWLALLEARICLCSGSDEHLDDLRIAAGIAGENRSRDNRPVAGVRGGEGAGFEQQLHAFLEIFREPLPFIGVRVPDGIPERLPQLRRIVRLLPMR